MKLVKIFVTLLAFIGLMEKGQSMDEKRKPMDPTLIATCETDIWKLYYHKTMPQEEKVALASKNFKPMIEQAFAVSDGTSAVPSFLKAMLVFGQMPQTSTKEEYTQKILPLVVQAFEDVKKISPYNSFDTKQAAIKELDWWVARRIEAERSTDNVGNIMAEAYGLIYGGNVKTYGRSAYLRADAARYRDKCQDEFGGLTDKDWTIIQDLLLKSYVELKAVLENEGK
jgi:hypothetical protein